MFQRVLICTDLNDGIQRLVQLVPALGDSGIKKVVFLRVVPLWQEGEIPREDTETMEATQRELSLAQAHHREGIEVVCEVKSGSPEDQIVQVAQEHQIDALILGASTRSFLTEKLFGSTTATIAQRMCRPLLTLRPQLISTYTEAELTLRCGHLFDYLLIPFDGSGAALYLVEQIKTIVTQNPHNTLKRCRLLWIQEPGARNLTNDYQRQQSQTKLEQAKADLEALQLTVETEVRQGEPLQELLEAAMVHDISAIAVSSRRANALLDWSIPSFGNEVLRRSWHPVLFFPPQR
jgi:nucleotide-binding universal stress UspA family protein